MIDANSFRIRIGCFSQKMRNKKFLYKFNYYQNYTSRENRLGKNGLQFVQSFCKIAAILCLLSGTGPCIAQQRITGRGWSDSSSTCTGVSDISRQLVFATVLASPVESDFSDQIVFATASGCQWLAGTRVIGMGVGWQDGNQEKRKYRICLEAGNFWARYVNGNKTERKGIRNNHLNIRSLRYKVIEVKKIINEQKCHIIGLSECELKKGPNFDIKELKIPGYDLLLPKSWDSAGFARVAVYVKKTFTFTQVHELEDDLVQTIWLKGGFKNSKQIYFCHGYREHQSSIGRSITDQRTYLERYLYQWEAATMHGNPSEPNEVHVCCDMNIDVHNGRWLEGDYPLISLSKLVQTACSVSNFSQLVSGITRTQYNSVSNMTDMSCIDHLYCNYKHRCSKVAILTNGASDHDQISYVRYSKDPPSPARIIRKRSYKEFEKEAFIEDLKKVDWSDVYHCKDVDTAAEVFGRKFRFILNEHAPWVKIQSRKNFSPWLTKETKDLMNLRDEWKDKFKELCTSNPGQISTQEETEAWNLYKYYRNKINNRKKN